MPPQGLLITGTDTGVGKTFVACGLAAALHRRGLRVAPFKPAETGCKSDPVSQELIPADAQLLRQASQTDAPLETICPYRFELPLAPEVAAKQAGISIDPQRVRDCYQALASEHDIILVETAGGILVPLAEDFHYGDLARLLDLSVLVVVGSKLGAINHTRLTFAYLESAGLFAVACVLNNPLAEKSPAIETNEAALRRLLQKSLYTIQYFPDGQPPWRKIGFDELAAQVLLPLPVSQRSSSGSPKGFKDCGGKRE
ncbi:MAG: dethiobiotin synthase [Acidobacteria bacterium]|nr:dethiobiotin synthase [Acidobacteriota bacterium]